MKFHFHKCLFAALILVSIALFVFPLAAHAQGVTTTTEPPGNNTFTNLLQGILTTLVSALIGFVLAYVRAKIKEATAKMTAQQLETINKLAGDLVLAAEQYGVTKVLSSIGEEKKQWVICQLEDELEKLKIPVDLHPLADAVEAAFVREVKRYQLPELNMLQPDHIYVSGANQVKPQ